MSDPELKEHGNIDASLDYFLRFNFQKDSVILDIGTNYGSFPGKLNHIGFKRVFGVDINEINLREGLLASQSDIGGLLVYDGEHLPFNDGSVDIITSFDVFEHIQDLPEFLVELRRVLRVEGWLIFQTPNKYINIPWEIIQHHSFTHWRKYHVSLQTYATLLKRLRDSDFEEAIIEKHRIRTNYNIDRVERIIGKYLSPLLFWILEKLPTQFSSNFWGYCRKKKQF